MEVLTVKKNKISGSGRRSFFKTENKRAYIALLILIILVGISVTARNRAMKSMEEQATAFDDEAWKEAVAESGIELPKEETNQEESFLDEPEKNEVVPTMAETSLKEEVAVPEAKPEKEIETVSTQEDTTFSRPSKGSIINDYSGDELVYSETMEDWRTHNGIDFSASEGDQVLACAKGRVKKVYEDDMLGITVEIEHSGGVISRYSGLQSLSFIQEGKEVKKGDIIGGVGKNGTLEDSGKHHLHFEILKNGEYENPNLYFVN